MATRAMAGGVVLAGDGPRQRRGRASRRPAGPGGASTTGGAARSCARAARGGTGSPELRRGGVLVDLLANAGK